MQEANVTKDICDWSISYEVGLIRDSKTFRTILFSYPRTTHLLGAWFPRFLPNVATLPLLGTDLQHTNAGNSVLVGGFDLGPISSAQHDIDLSGRRQQPRCRVPGWEATNLVLKSGRVSLILGVQMNREAE